MRKQQQNDLFVHHSSKKSEVWNDFSEGDSPHGLYLDQSCENCRRSNGAGSRRVRQIEAGFPPLPHEVLRHLRKGRGGKLVSLIYGFLASILENLVTNYHPGHHQGQTNIMTDPDTQPAQQEAVEEKAEVKQVMMIT